MPRAGVRQLALEGMLFPGQSPGAAGHHGLPGSRHVGFLHGGLEGRNQEAKEAPLIPETHLALGRVHVHVHRGGIHRKAQESNWLPPIFQHPTICVLQHTTQDSIPQESPVQQPNLAGGVAPGNPWGTHVPTNR